MRGTGFCLGLSQTAVSGRMQKRLTYPTAADLYSFKAKQVAAEPQQTEPVPAGGADIVACNLQK